MEQDFASIFKDFESEADICRGQQSCGLFGPLHKAYIASVEIITESRALPFFGIAEAIQIVVEQV